MSDLIELRRKYEALKVTEDSKDAIIERLFSHVQIVEGELKDEKNEHENQKRLVQVYKDDATKCKTELDENKRKEARLQFVSVLVDGDHMNFVDTFVQGGNQGGRSAAKALIEAVQDHIREVKPNVSPNIQYKVHVFANVSGLAKAYHDSNIVGSKDVLREFIQGFNMETPLCDFVDAGRGKECADVKIGALFEQYLLDIHCQHIVFGGSADNGYARILGHHRGSGNISLVEGPPFARELRDLVGEFKTTSFPDVFRKRKLSRRVSFGDITVPPTVTPPRTPTPNYASIAKSAPPVPEDSSSLAKLSARTSKTGSPRLAVYRNANGDRVDFPLKTSLKFKVDALKQQKFCNQFHILGTCYYGESCTHRHGQRLTGQDLTDLMWIARLSACQVGLQCDDESCFSGHRCPQKNCTTALCRFPHDVDTKIV